VREFRLHGFGRGAVSNDRPYRASGRDLLLMTQSCRPKLRREFIRRKCNCVSEQLWAATSRRCRHAGCVANYPRARF
jgi:hypothetical protein